MLPISYPGIPWQIPAIQKEMDNEENVIFAGRLAQYKYYNMDLVVKNALEIFETQIKRIIKFEGELIWLQYGHSTWIKTSL